MALQFMVAAAVQRDPLAIWQTMLRRARPLAAGWPTFLAAAAATGKPAPDTLALLDAMMASQTDWACGVLKLTGAGLLRRRTEAELAQATYNDRYRTAAIFHLLKHACSKRYGFNSEPGVAILDAPPGTCDGAGQISPADHERHRPPSRCLRGVRRTGAPLCCGAAGCTGR